MFRIRLQSLFIPALLALLPAFLPSAGALVQSAAPAANTTPNTAQNTAPNTAPNTTPNSGKTVQNAASLTIRLEQKKADRVTSMRPEHVFEPGDVVRFRLTSLSDGYLYVVNHGSSGSYSPLFPAPGTRADNRIRSGSDYLVPSTEDGWFEIEGPAGFEVVYFLLSPAPLNISAASDKAPRARPSALPDSLKPRCNDAIFQARGECVDGSAGPAPLARGAPLPPQISTAAPNASRDIVFTSGDEENSVTASVPATKPATKPEASSAHAAANTSPIPPVVYTFRLAHR